jgi:ABC-2 type transport system ATP-binding protein
MISAQGLTKYYGDRAAIQDLSFDIAKGEIVGILGLNGAGKTTTLRVLACLLLPSAGRVSINGLDIFESPHEIRKQVGFLPEVPPLYQEMTVEGYLAFTGELRGMKSRDARRRVDEVLEITQTKDVRGDVIASLSHGYRQRVGIGQAIVHQPGVLILDEPIAGLDPVQIVEMRQMIRGLKGRHTILVSSHILPEISQTCDRIMVIRDGRIVASGSEEELMSHLSSRKRLRLLVRGEKEPVQKLISGIDGVVKVELHNPTEVAPYRGEEPLLAQHLEVETSKDLREALSREIVQAGFGLLQISPAEPELESIFIQLTHTGGKGVGGGKGGKEVLQ